MWYSLLAVDVGAVVGPLLLQLAGPDAGGDHGRSEAGALLVGPVDDDHGALGLDLVVVQGAQHLERAHDPEDAVEATALGLGVDVGAAHDRGQRVVLGRAAAEDVAHRVDRDLQVDLLAPLHEEVAGLLVLVGEGEPLHAAARSRADLGHLLEALLQPRGVDA